MNNKKVIKRIEVFVKNKLSNDSTGHDWAHIQRVRKYALQIGKKEKADLFIIDLMALLHDIADWKFNADEQAGSKIAKFLLKENGLPPKDIDNICYLIDNISFKGGHNPHPMKAPEAKVVQDADRLDALGALGIARAFAYGGFRNRPMHIPGSKPGSTKNFKQYRKYQGTTINHFYEKLLLLKNRMHTKTAKQMAERRHKFMEQYLKEFFREWNGS